MFDVYSTVSDTKTLVLFFQQDFSHLDRTLRIAQNDLGLTKNQIDYENFTKVLAFYNINCTYLVDDLNIKDPRQGGISSWYRLRAFWPVLKNYFDQK